MKNIILSLGLLFLLSGCFKQEVVIGKIIEKPQLVSYENRSFKISKPFVNINHFN